MLEAVTGRRAVREGFTVGVTNPKALLAMIGVPPTGRILLGFFGVSLGLLALSGFRTEAGIAQLDEALGTGPG